MKPNDLLKKNIEIYLIEDFKALGFKYLKSSDSFKRTKGDFIQEIVFCSDRYNTEDNCEFWTMWSVQSKQYTKWHQLTYGTKPLNNAIWGSADWNIIGWESVVPNRLCLQNNNNDKDKMLLFKNACLKIGIPTLERFSNHNECAKFNLENAPLDLTKTINLLIMSDQNKLALNTAKEYIKKFELDNTLDQGMELQELKNIVKTIT